MASHIQGHSSPDADDHRLGLLAVLALILANGYFVAAEFAFVAVRKGKLEEAAAAGDGRGERERWRCCASCRSCCRAPQLGITATSLIVGCIAEPTLGRAFAPLLGAVGLGETAARGVTLTVGSVLATVGQMVLGELGPKSLALEEPERFALALDCLAPVVIDDTLACLAHAQPPDGATTRRVLDDESHRLAFDAWTAARENIVAEWNLAADPANLHRRSPRRCVTRPRWCGPTARPP